MPKTQYVNNINILGGLHQKSKQKHPKGKKFNLFGKKHPKKTAKKHGYENIAAVGTDKFIAHKEGDNYLNGKEYDKRAQIPKPRFCVFVFHILHRLYKTNYSTGKQKNKDVFTIIL